jgi:hypothetical protein
MVRWNFGRSSGVAVDVCNQHGIWFDAQELAHVMRWIRSGNMQAAQGDIFRLRQSSLAARSAQLRPPRRADAPMLDAGGDTASGEFVLAADVVATIASVLGRFFR